MSKLKLLILDASVVIFLHERGIWSQLITRCEVLLPRTVVDEAAFFADENGDRHEIDIHDDISRRGLVVFDVSLTDLRHFQRQFDSRYISQIDPGELEALAYLCASTQDYSISSSDAIVYRVLRCPLTKEVRACLWKRSFPASGCSRRRSAGSSPGGFARSTLRRDSRTLCRTGACESERYCRQGIHDTATPPNGRSRRPTHSGRTCSSASFRQVDRFRVDDAFAPPPGLVTNLDCTPMTTDPRSDLPS